MSLSFKQKADTRKELKENPDRQKCVNFAF